MFQLETAVDNSASGCSTTLLYFTVQKLFFLPPIARLNERVLFKEMEEGRLSNLDNCNYAGELLNCWRVATCKIDAWRQLAIVPSVFVVN